MQNCNKLKELQLLIIFILLIPFLKPTEPAFMEWNA